MEHHSCLVLENVERGAQSDCSSVSFADDTKTESPFIPVTKKEFELILKSNKSCVSGKTCESIKEDGSEISFRDDKSEASVPSERGDKTVISVTIKNGGHPKIQRYTSENLAEIEEIGPADICCLKEGYKLGKEIGEGAYSSVRAAEVMPLKIESDRKIARLVQKNRHRWVAVKILNKNKAPTDYTTKFIGREIQALHRIRGHENVVEIYDVFETSDFLFIVTELCQKGDLFHYINASADVGQTGLPEDQARQFFVQICNGMQYCHQRGVVHRDFKCENVLISDDENTVKITDFGFACTVPNKRLMLSTPCGSYSYAAPEVLFGKSYDPFVSDVWSLGVVLFCMLNGTTPYGHVQLSLLEEYMGSQRLQFQKISFEAKHLLRQLLTYEPRKRPKIPEILKSAWITRQKTHFVERIITPVVEDRSHLVGIVSRLNVPTSPNPSTEHRQCINFSRICFSNGTESVCLKSRQPNRERNRHLHLIPILRRTRMSVVEFKERMGLNINQSPPMAQILKNIISGTNAAGLNQEGIKESNKPIPDLPANLSTQQGDTNQPMVEYLAEMWMDVDRTVVSTQESQESGQPLQVTVQQHVAVAEDNVKDAELQPLENSMSHDQPVEAHDTVVDTKLLEDLNTNPTEVEAVNETHEAIQLEANELTEDEQKTEDVQTESSFCTCTNPDTASTYTVHLPQPDQPPMESPPPTPNSRWPDLPIDRYGFPRGESRVATTTPVDQDWSKSPTPTGRLSRLQQSKYTELDRYSLTIAERAKLLNDKAARLLARSKNGTPYRHATSVPKHVQKFNIEKVATKVQSFTLRKPLTNINKTKPSLAANNCKVFPPKQQSVWNKSLGTKVNVYQRTEKSSMTNRAAEEKRLMLKYEKEAALQQKANGHSSKMAYVEDNNKNYYDTINTEDVEGPLNMPEKEDVGKEGLEEEQQRTMMKQTCQPRLNLAVGSKSTECKSAMCHQEGADDDAKHELKGSYSQSKLETRPPSGELVKRESGDSIPTNGSGSDEELQKIAMADQHEEQQSPTKIPGNLQQSYGSSMKFDTHSVSQALNERLNYLGQKKSDLDMCSPVPQSPDDPIYERHARTPVKDKSGSRANTPDVKKIKRNRRFVVEPESRNSESLIYGGGRRFLRKGGNIRASELKSEVKKLIKGGTQINTKENKSLPVLQINKSMINKIDRSSIRKAFPSKPLSPTKSILRKSRSPFPNPLTNPQLWQGTLDTVQITDKVRSTPTIACPLLPQKNNYMNDACKRPYRIRLSETGTNSSLYIRNTDKGLFPPVTNLVFEDNN